MAKDINAAQQKLEEAYKTDAVARGIIQGAVATVQILTQAGLLKKEAVQG